MHENKLELCLKAEGYLEPSQTSKLERFDTAKSH